MRIGVIGAGNVGKTLGGQLATKHTVKYGCRDPAKHPGIGAAPVPSVCDWAEVLLVCTPGFSTAAEAEALATSFGPGVRGARCAQRRGRLPWRRRWLTVPLVMNAP
jgi:predicted dinucleotide-binding enzyme